MGIIGNIYKAQENYENGILSDYARAVLERSAELEILHGK